MASRFRRAFYKLTPSWSHTGDCERVLYSQGVIMDAALERLEQGLNARFPTRTQAAGSLALIGQDRNIVRGIGESDESYALRLREWRYPRGHRVRGNAFAMLTQLRAYFAPVGPIRARTVDARGNWHTIDYDGSRSHNWNVGDWDWDGAPPAPRFARFWVILYIENLYRRAPLIGDPELWGGAIGIPGYAIGAYDGITVDINNTIRSIVRTWKPAGTKAEGVIFSDSDDAFIPGVTEETDGTWDDPNNRVNVAEFLSVS